METKNLLSHIEFENKIDVPELSDSDFRRLSRNSRNLLSSTLQLGFFIPTDEEGDVLEEPKPGDYFDIDRPIDQYSEQDKSGLDRYYSSLMTFESAKERCLFEGFEILETKDYNHSHPKSVCMYDILHPYWFSKEHQKWELVKGISTIEDLVKYNLQLTDNAIKNLGL